MFLEQLTVSGVAALAVAAVPARRLDKVSIDYQVKRPKTANIIIDTTYLGRKFGLMVFMDNTTKAVLYYAIVSHETNSAYKQGIDHLATLGVDYKALPVMVDEDCVRYSPVSLARCASSIKCK